MFKVVCHQCNEERFIKNKPRGTLCRRCSYKNKKGRPRQAAKLYTRTCIDCGDIKTSVFKRDAKALRCLKCSIKHNGIERKGSTRKHYKDLVRYWYFCPTCPSIREVTIKRKTNYCSKCSNKRSNIQIKEDNNTLQVTSELNNRIKSCREHTRKPKVYKKKVNKNKYQQIGTDGAKHNKVTVKFQVVDLDTMEAPIKKRKQKEIPQCSKEKEQSMINKWLSKNKVTVVEHKEQVGYTDQSMNL